MSTTPFHSDAPRSGSASGGELSVPSSSPNPAAVAPPAPPPGLANFPDAPDDAWLSDEGWLCVGDEAWTAEEWRTQTMWRPNEKAEHNRRRAKMRRLLLAMRRGQA